VTDVLSGARILVADDQAEVAKTFCRPLQAARAFIKPVSNGEDALAAVLSQPFDLLLIDMRMPPEEWGGLWLLEQLKASLTRIPALVLSGEGGMTETIEAMRLGATRWITKDQAAEQLLPTCV